MTILLEIHITTNTQRKVLVYDNIRVVNPDTLFANVYDILRQQGFKIPIGTIKSLTGSIQITSQNICDFIVEGKLQLKYCNIVCPKNAYEFDRYEGVVFFFHTQENNHRDYPHIHAKYSGEEISIYLNDFRVEGKFKNRKKQRIAMEYVKSNLKAIINEWYKIIDR